MSKWAAVVGWARARIDYLVTGIGSALAVQSWFARDSIIAHGDFGPVGLLAPQTLAAKAAPLWNTFTEGLGGRNFTVVEAPFEAVTGLIRALGASPSVTQRVLLSGIMLAQGLAAIYFLRSVWPRSHPIARILGASFYNFNVMRFFFVPAPVALIGFALLPLMAGIATRGLSSRAPRYALYWAIGTLGFSYVARNPSLALTLLLAVAIHVAQGGETRSLALFARRALPTAVVLNLWWLIPAILSLTGSSSVSELPVTSSEWAWTHVRDRFVNIFTLNTSWAWPQRQYFPYADSYDHPLVQMLLYVPALLTFGALMTTRGRQSRRVVLLGAIALFLFLLSNGLQPPFGGLNRFLSEHVPGFWLLREPAMKLLPVAVLPMAALLTLTVDVARNNAWMGRRRISMAGPIVVILGAAVTPLVAFPLFTGSVVPAERPLLPSGHIKIPTYWQDAANHLNLQADQDGAVLLLPVDDFYGMPYRWGYYGADTIPTELISRPVLSGMNPAYLPPPKPVRLALAEAERAILSAKLDEIPWWLSALGADYVLVRGDIDLDLARRLNRTLQPPARYVDSLERAPGVTESQRFGPLVLFSSERNNGLVSTRTALEITSPNAGAPSSSVLQRFSDAALTQAGSAGPDAESVLQPFTPTHQLQKETETTFPTLAELPVPGTDVTSGAPRLDLVRRYKEHTSDIRNAYVVVPPADPVPVVSLPQDSSGVVLASADTSRFSIMVAGHQNLVTNPSFSRRPAKGSGWGQVGDCNRFDARSLTEVGIDARLAAGRTGEDTALALQAREHTACISQSITLVPERNYQLSFSYRNDGSSTSRTCLLITTPDDTQCIELPTIPQSSDWSTFRSAFRAPADTSLASLYLYTVGRGERTLNLYDDVRVSPLVPHSTWRIGALATSTEVAEASVTTALSSLNATRKAGPNLVVNGSFEQTTYQDSAWSPVGDCHAYDQRTVQQVGIASRLTTGVDGTALSLAAEDHAACVSQEIGVLPGLDYKLTFSYRGSPAPSKTACVYVSQLRRCIADQVLEGSPEWRAQRVRFHVPPRVRNVSLYLYAFAGPGTPTIRRFDQVEMRAILEGPVASISITPRSSYSPEASIRRLDTNRYRIDVGNPETPFILTLNQTFDTGWRLVGREGNSFDQLHFLANGYSNGWVVPPGNQQLILEFVPERLASASIWASVIGGLLLVTSTAIRYAPRHGKRT